MKMLQEKHKKMLKHNFKHGHGQDLKPVVKLFGGSACTWLLSELDPESNVAFGLCDLGFGTPELGYVSLDELKALKFPPFGLPIERDMHWEANKTLIGYAKEASELGYIKANY